MNYRKQLLAAIRNGDYAHPGEEEAIELTMRHIEKNPKQLLLDVGGGLGGTANYLEKNGWGSVTAIDIDPEMVTHTQQHYPHIRTFCCPANELETVIATEKFNVIYSFSAFFCFAQQEITLSVLAKFAHPNTQLLIFDYTSPTHFNQDSPFKDSRVNGPSLFNPINVDQVESMLSHNNWHLQEIVDLSKQFKIWYEWLLTRIEQQKDELTLKFGSDTFEDLYAGYQRLLALIEQGKIGGGILTATPHENIIENLELLELSKNRLKEKDQAIQIKFEDL